MAHLRIIVSHRPPSFAAAAAPQYSLPKPRCGTAIYLDLAPRWSSRSPSIFHDYFSESNFMQWLCH